MRITQALVREVKRSNALKLHPQAWHDFQGLREVEAINWAIEMERGRQPTPAQIVARAKEYLDSLNAGNKADLAEIGRQKMSEGGKATPDARFITNDKPLVQHNTQKVIADAAGVSTGQIAKAEIVKREAPELLQP